MFSIFGYVKCSHFIISFQGLLQQFHHLQVTHIVMMTQLCLVCLLSLVIHYLSPGTTTVVIPSPTGDLYSWLLP